MHVNKTVSKQDATEAQNKVDLDPKTHNTHLRISTNIAKLASHSRIPAWLNGSVVSALGIRARDPSRAAIPLGSNLGQVVYSQKGVFGA